MHCEKGGLRVSREGAEGHLPSCKAPALKKSVPQTLCSHALILFCEVASQIIKQEVEGGGTGRGEKKKEKEEEEKGKKKDNNSFHNTSLKDDK